ncbi:MAG: UvrD-helicase domain-containing protein [Candidatus Symbiothrix sp.]|jgi:ATP-dependent exoDNAse (exonuclease V) beta subunit|nr:UvrD-helicase domain-containing protein [Candidatus Symbiothrix sp.]
MSRLKVYKASAGSGKTYTLALEYIRELILASKLHGNTQQFRHILAVTFTKEATGEMKDRILAELYGLAFKTSDSISFLASLQEKLTPPHTSPIGSTVGANPCGRPIPENEIRSHAKIVLHAILHDYSRLNITTIDSFFQRVLRNLARELGRSSKFNLEMNTNKVLQDAVHATIEKANQNKQILDWLTTYVEQKLDDDRNWRIENELFDFSRCIYNEFFQEREKDLRQQLEANPKLFHTLKAQQEQIKKECKTVFKETYQHVQELIDSHGLAMEDFMLKGLPIKFFRDLAEGRAVNLYTKTIQNCTEDATAWTTKTSKYRDEIAGLAAQHLMPLLNKTIPLVHKNLTAQMILGNLHQLGLIWDISKEIADENEENNRFMLSDTAMFLNEMIDHSDAPFIYEKLGSEIRHVMIDEFQDTSRLQWSNFKALLSNILSEDRFSLIVGDVKQSIYRWRNGDWRILSQVGEQLNADVETLDYNYRSEKNVIDFNNAFFTRAAELLNELYVDKWGNDGNSPFPSTYSEKEVHQKTHKKTAEGYVSVDFVESGDGTTASEAMKLAVLEKLKTLQAAGIPANDICILTRTNKEIIDLADYLANVRHCGLDPQSPELLSGHYLDIISNEAFQLKSSQAIQIIIEALRLVADPENKIAAEHLNQGIPAPHLRGGRPAGMTADGYCGQPQGLPLRSMPLFELIGELYRRLHLDKLDGQSAYLFAFYDAVSTYLNDNPADLPHFLQYWDDELKTRTIPTGSSVDGVRAMTIHKSKGLQFHTVIVPYCDWNINPKSGTTVWCEAQKGVYDVELLPINYNKGMQETVFASQYQEETVQSWLDNLNVLYVGFTRAEHNLMILSKSKKSLKGSADITTVADLLQLSGVPLETGTLSHSARRVAARHDPTNDIAVPVIADLTRNPLKERPDSIDISFVSEHFQPGKSIFKQSNKSREFVAPPLTPPLKGEETPPLGGRGVERLYGNIMHSIFERIHRLEDIEKNVDSCITQGLIQPAQKQEYIDQIHAAIRESKVEHWFDGQHTSYKEHSIVLEENGEIVSKRPDRVLFTADATTVIDYKFGKPHQSHAEQVKQYMCLLEKMNYPNVQGYLWYVDDRKIVLID